MSQVAPAPIQCREFLVRRVLGEERTQVAVRATITVPPEKPPVEQVIDCTATARVTKIEKIKNKVIIQGVADVQVTYVADVPKGDQPVHHVEQEVTFTQSVEVPGLQVGDDADVFVQLMVETCKAGLKMNATRHHGDACCVPGKREILVTVIIKKFVKVTKTEPTRILVNAPGATLGTIELEEVIAFGERQVIISDQVDVREITQGKKPCPEKVLSVIADVVIRSTEIINDRKVVVEGVLKLQIVYVAKTWQGDQPVHHVHVDIPFTQFVELNRPVAPDDVVETVVTIEDVSARAKGECGISINAVIQLRAEVTRTREITVVTALRQPIPGVEPRRIRSDVVLGRRATQVVVRDEADIPDQKPDAEKALECIVVENRVEETEILPGADKVLVRGVAVVKVLYVANVPSQPVHAFTTEVPWTTFVEFPVDITDDDNVAVTVQIEFSDCELVNKRTVAIDLVVRVAVKVTRIQQPIIFVCLVLQPEVPELPCPGTLINVTVRPGDTCFSIARANNTTVADIQARNPGVDCNNLQPGTVLVVCRGLG